MDKPNTKIHFFETYLAVIRNSVGSRMFRNFFMEIGGEKIDATRNGEVSCAFFASNVLHMFSALKLITEPHLTVDSTEKDLLARGWREISEPRAGAVLIWEAKESHGGRNRHIGFYTGNGLAISNDSDTGVPAVSSWTFGEKKGKSVRKVEKILWHDALEN